MLLKSFYFLLIHLIASQVVAGLPRHTDANPNGHWSSLPKGRNYVFCGDRIFYASSFDSEVSIDYENGTRKADFKKHCDFRRASIKRQFKNAKAGEPPLILASYQKLNGFLSEIPKSKKHKAYIEKNGYHYKEIRGQINEGELNRLRVSNLLLPYLSKSEFEQAYKGSTNNPKFLEAEYSRYSSNVLTQNPAMLYTADGSLYYFSFDLSKSQLAKLGKTLGGMGGGGAGSLGGSGGGGSRGPASVNGKAEIPTEGLEAQFPGFVSEQDGLRVGPEGTQLPSNMGVSRSTTFNVPSSNDIRRNLSLSRGSGTSSRNVASSGAGSRSRGSSVGSGSGGGSSGSGSSFSPTPSTSLNAQMLGKLMAQQNRGDGRRFGGASRGSSNRGSGEVSFSGGSGGSDAGSGGDSGKIRGTGTNSDESALPGMEVQGVVSGPAPVTFVPLPGRENIDGTLISELMCKSSNTNRMEQLLFHLANYDQSNYEQYIETVDGMAKTKEKFACLPLNHETRRIDTALFCGASSSERNTEYRNRCILGLSEEDSENVSKLPPSIASPTIAHANESCKQEIDLFQERICREYFTFNEGNTDSRYTKQQLKECRDNLLLLGCGKPDNNIMAGCNINFDENGKPSIQGNIINKIRENDNSFFEAVASNIPRQIAAKKYGLRSINELKKDTHLKHHQEILSTNFKNDLNNIRSLKLVKHIQRIHLIDLVSSKYDQVCDGIDLNKANNTSEGIE